MSPRPQVVILAAGLGTRLGKPHPKPLTPLQFLERSASVYPDRLALVHGSRRQNRHDSQ